MAGSYPSGKHPSGSSSSAENRADSAASFFRGDGHDEHPSGTPPPYSGPSTPLPPTISTPSTFVGLPKLNYTLYAPPDFKLSADKTTITTSNPIYSADVNALRRLIKEQATLPPKLMIQVKGTSDNAVDFDIKLNLMALFCPDGERWNYVTTIADGEVGMRGGTSQSTEPSNAGGIDGWVKQYCNEDTVKQFTIERKVSNLDAEYLEGRLHALIASTLYRGHVEVSFPMTHNKVTVKSSYKGKSFLTSVASLFSSTRKFEVVRVIWPYASVKPGGDGRRFAVMSEETWWNNWKDAIRHAILSKRRGWVTVEDQLEFLMSRDRDIGNTREWGQNLM